MFDTFILTNKAGLEQRGNMEFGSRGIHFFFVDSDDQIDACGLATVLEELQQNSKFDDIVFCNASIHDRAGKISSRDELQYFSGKKIDILNDFLLNRVSPTVMFNLYKRKFLIDKNIQFRSGLHEDVDFSFEHLQKWILGQSGLS